MNEKKSSRLLLLLKRKFFLQVSGRLAKIILYIYVGHIRQMKVAIAMKMRKIFRTLLSDKVLVNSFPTVKDKQKVLSTITSLKLSNHAPIDSHH